MADKKLPKDDITEQRWLREHFKTLGEKHPRLKTPIPQERLTAYLTQEHTEEHDPCPENPPDAPEVDQQAPDSSTAPNG